MREGLVTANKSAEAALKNAQAVINAERAWVFCTAKQIGNESCQLSLRNHGRTPAYVISVRELEKVVPPTTKLESTPDYGLPTQFVSERVLSPGDAWEADDWRTNLSEVLPGEMLEEVRSGRLRYYLYGVIEYRDVLPGSQLHETRFCYFYSTIQQQFIVGGPSDYTKCT